MAISDTINSIKANLTAAYEKLSEKGATIPAAKNIENLAATIDTITGGGGGGVPLEGDYGSFVYNGTTVQVTNLLDYLTLTSSAGSESYSAPVYSLSTGSYSSTGVTSYTFGSDCSFTPPFFLGNAGVTSLNGITPSIIGHHFLFNGGGYAAPAAFNGGLDLSGVVSIGNDFMSGQSTFNQPLTIPATVTSIGSSFMYNNNAMSNTITVETTAAPGGTGDITSLATSTSTAALYVSGVELAGDGAAAWLAALPNRTGSPYRKLYSIPDGPTQLYLTVVDTAGVSHEVTNPRDAYEFFYASNPAKAGIANWASVKSIDITPAMGTWGALPEVGASFAKNATNLETMTGFENLTSITKIGTDFLYGCTKFDSPLTIPNGVTATPNNFLYNCSNFNSSLTLPTSGLSSMGTNFLRGCTKFNQPLSLRARVYNTRLILSTNFLYGCAAFNSALSYNGSEMVPGGYFMYGCGSFNDPSITAFTQKMRLASNDQAAYGAYFLANCTALNQPITLNGIERGNYVLQNCASLDSQVTLQPNYWPIQIGTYFMSGCTSYAKPITFPASGTLGISSFPTYFMYNCDSFIGPLTIPGLSSVPQNVTSMFNTLSTTNATAPMYTHGVEVRLPSASVVTSVRSGLPDRTSSPYRKLNLAIIE